MIGRRPLLAGAAAVAAASPVAAQTARPLVGFIAASSRQERFERAFVTGLRDQGLVLGRSIDVEFHWTAGTLEPMRAIVADLLARRVAVIVTGGGNVTLLARTLTDAVPIVFATAIDPIDDGLVVSLARPGGNVTGLSLQSVELAPKLIEVLRELVPKAMRVAVLHSTLSRTSAGRRAAITAAARTIGIETREIGFANVEAMGRAFDEAAGMDGAIVLRDFLVEANMRAIVAHAARVKLPVIYEQAEPVRAGGLVSYAADFVEMHRRAAGYVARILRGVAPADLPVEQPVRFELVLNLRTARALGLSPPAVMLDYADEVIE
ncbi:MAG: ABC transporter substrate-binding protein [Alphaproteobacteria bacterium]|nr:ABC transporter substrate-binding protein [Alphaproteobacteria bacterium]